MSYKVEQRENAYVIINTETMEVKATHTDKEAAERQASLLNHVEKEWTED